MLNDIKQEFWGDLQADFYTQNSAVYLANQSLKELISTNGKKVHKPIMSHSQVGTYTPYSDISFQRKTATDNTLTVDQFKYAADEIDITDKNQTPYELLRHSLVSIRKGLLNVFEQTYLSEISNAYHAINNGTAFEMEKHTVQNVFQEAGAKLGAFDVPTDTDSKAAVFGPYYTENIRSSIVDRYTSLGDSVATNGVIGPYRGWTVVQNNNLPWSATLTIGTNPTNGDTVTISGVTFKFVSSLGSDPGNVLIGATVANTRANLKAAVEGGAGAGSTYVDISSLNDFILRKKRAVKCTAAEAMAFTGFGDIGVKETLTAETNVWSNQQQTSIFMIRGAIDAVMQFMGLEVGDKEKGFADLPKGIMGFGTKMFDDGKLSSVKVVLDASKF